MESYTIIVLLFGAMVLFLLIMIYFINRIIQYKNKIDNSFLAIREIFDNQVDILDDMIDFLNENIEYEKSYQKRLKEAKETLVTIKNNKDGIDSYKKIEKDVSSFCELENIYKNLNRNKKYLQIKNDILSNEEKLVYAMDIYDKGVINYNKYKEKKLIYWLSRLCNIPEYSCYNK